MKDFQRILEECLTRLSNGTATVDECLARYPEHAEQLKPLLCTALRLSRGREVIPSPTFNAYTRSAVIQYIRSHPRQPRSIMPLFQRSALAFAVLVMALLVTGTAQAQSALPGETFYPWKLTSERVWRAFTLDPVETDLIFSERRLNEWIAVADDPTLSAGAMDNYLDSLSKFESVGDVETLRVIVPALKSQQQTLNKAGLSNPRVNNYLSDVVVSIPTVVATQVLPTATHVLPTDIPPTNVPPTNVPPTSVPPTDVPPTATNIPPTATEIPPTATEVPPTATDVPPTPVPTDIVPTDVPPTAVPTDIVPTDVPPTDAPLP